MWSRAIRNVYLFKEKSVGGFIFGTSHYRSILLHILSDKWMFAAFINRYSLLDQKMGVKVYFEFTNVFDRN